MSEKQEKKIREIKFENYTVDAKNWHIFIFPRTSGVEYMNKISNM